MSLEVSARAEEGHYSILSDAEDAEILKVYEETGKGIVPDKVLQSVLDTMIVSS